MCGTSVSEIRALERVENLGLQKEPDGSSAEASTECQVTLVATGTTVVASPGARRPRPRPIGAARSLEDFGDGGARNRYDDDDDGVFVEEVLVVAGALESPLRRSLLLNDVSLAVCSRSGRCGRRRP